MNRNRRILMILPVLAALGAFGIWRSGLLDPASAPDLAEHAAGTLAHVGGDAVFFETLRHSAVSSWSREASLLVRTESQWHRILESQADSESGDLSLFDEEIDWAEEMVVVLAMGETAAPDADLRIVEVYRRGSDLVVDVIREPGVPSRKEPASAPVHMVRVPRQEVESLVVNVLSGDDAPRTATGTSWGGLKKQFGR